MKNLRIAFTGPECSGKTTASKAVAAALPQGKWIAEIARLYLEQLPETSAYTAQDVRAIAEQTWHSFQNVEGILVADTEFFVLDIWMQEVFNCGDERILQYRDRFLFDHYFLCAPDMPWEHDPLRQNPHDRDRLFRRYDEALREAGVPYTVLKGPLEERIAVALRIIQAL